MNLTETVRLLNVARIACPGMTILDGMDVMWQRILGDLDFDEAVDAIAAHAADESRIVTPADIRKRAKAAKQDRLTRMPQLDAPIRATDPPPEWHALKDEFSKRRQKREADRREPSTLGDLLPAVAEQVEAATPEASA